MGALEKEKQRELTESEKERLEHFDDVCYDLEKKGYRGTELVISIVKANVFAFILLIPVTAAGLGLFFWYNGVQVRMNFTLRELIVFIIGLFVLTALHEFIHGFAWGLYSEHYFADIEFGFMKQYLTPYCTCKEPLRKKPYIAGALMPLIALGILPMAASIINGSYIMLITGVIMTDAAAGDIMIVYKILKHRTSSDDVLYMDHPTMGGVYVFERQNG